MNPRREPQALLWVIGAIIWLGLWRNLAAHWNVNPQYSFGWLVPVLQLFLASRRWSTRPQPQPPVFFGKALVIAAALALAPTWLIAQPNPDWPLVNWLLAGEVVALTLGTLALLGGPAWARHLAFPVVFIFTAVPWPSALEVPLVQGLMRLVAAVTVELLNFGGTPALQHGNLIEIGRGMLGVDEACSGVRSLQATLMATLFLGEFYRFRVSVRTALVLIGFGAALLTNVARTMFLSLAAARDGIAAIARWHDPAGFTILTACLVVVWLCALFFLRQHREPQPAREPLPAHPLPRFFGSALSAWVLVVCAATEWWFHQPGAIPPAPWVLAPPPGAREEPVEPRTAELLRFDQGRSASWPESDGSRWMLFFFEWKPGPIRSRILARMHRPEVCLPALGLRQLAGTRVILIEGPGVVLPFEASQFADATGAQVFTYFCPWEIQREPGGASVTFSDALRFESLRQVWRRERALGQQVAEIVVFGYTRAEDADAAFRRHAPRLIQPRGSVGTPEPTVPK